MNLDTYQEAAAQTHKHADTPYNSLGCHAVGLAEEACEVAALFTEGFYGLTVETENRETLKKELGDVLWYTSAIASKAKIPLSVVWESCSSCTSSPRKRSFNATFEPFPLESVRLLCLLRAVGDASGMLKKHLYHDHPLNTALLTRKLGQVLMALQHLANYYWTGIDDVMAANLAKLAARYPNGFTSADSIARKDVTP